MDNNRYNNRLYRQIHLLPQLVYVLFSLQEISIPECDTKEEEETRPFSAMKSQIQLYFFIEYLSVKFCL